MKNGRILITVAYKSWIHWILHGHTMFHIYTQTAVAHHIHITITNCRFFCIFQQSVHIACFFPTNGIFQCAQQCLYYLHWGKVHFYKKNIFHFFYNKTHPHFICCLRLTAFWPWTAAMCGVWLKLDTDAELSLMQGCRDADVVAWIHWSTASHRRQAMSSL